MRKIIILWYWGFFEFCRYLIIRWILSNVSKHSVMCYIFLNYIYRTWTHVPWIAIPSTRAKTSLGRFCSFDSRICTRHVIYIPNIRDTFIIWFWRWEFSILFNFLTLIIFFRWSLFGWLWYTSCFCFMSILEWLFQQMTFDFYEYFHYLQNNHFLSKIQWIFLNEDKSRLKKNYEQNCYFKDFLVFSFK